MSRCVARKLVQSFRQQKESQELRLLSRRERQVLTFVSKGYQNKEIAREISVAPETVRVHLRNIYEKLNVGSRSEAVVKFLG